MRQSFMEALIAEARVDSSIWLLTADLGYSFLESFQKEFPDRFVNVGVAEQNLISIAAGLALSGKKVFVYSIINFLVFRALGQIRQDICANELSIHLVGVGTGLSYRFSGYSHFGVEDIAAIRAFETFKIFSPADGFQTQIAMQEILKSRKPTYLRLGKSDVKERFPSLCAHLTPYYKIGKKALIICYGDLLWKILKAVKDEDVSVMSLIQVDPIVEECLCDEISRFSHLIVIEEHKKKGGFTEGLCELLIRKALSVKLTSLCFTEKEMFCDDSFDLHSYL